MFRLISICIGYLLGCFQTAFIIGKLKQNIDIREYGSGNSGTTNAIRVLGWKLGALTFIVDILKAVLAVILSSNLLNDPLAGFYAGVGVILGHNWPVFLKFKGGKGIASTIGVMLAVDYRIGLIMIAVLAIVLVISKYVSLGSILMVIAIPIFLTVWYPEQKEWIIIGIFLMLLALFQHKTNISRLLTGTENKIGHKKNLVAKKANQ